MKLFRILLISYLLLLISYSPSYAQTIQPQKETFTKATVTQIKKEEIKDIAGQKNLIQTLSIQILEGEEKGKKVDIQHGMVSSINSVNKLKKGDTVVVLKTQSNTTTYSIVDIYRLPMIAFIAGLFFFIVILAAGFKGIGSIIGMLMSLGIIVFFIVPFILKGYDPLLISILGSTGILLSTIFLAHGFSKKTLVAAISTCISLILTGILATLFVQISRLSGLGSDAASMLQLGSHIINFQGLLLGGMIIGALGVLDDITTAQSAIIFELHTLNNRLKFSDLFQKGFSVGREHIASLVNTLVLAYAGASLALFIIFVINPTGQPYWVILNSEIITEEIIRTLSGSIGIILAVPITTALAAFFCKYKISLS